MAVKTLAIAQGTVMRVEGREGTSTNKDGTSRPWKMVDVLIVGDNTLCQAGLSRDLVNAPPSVGDVVTAQIEVGVYRDDDSVQIVKWLDVKQAAKQ